MKVIHLISGGDVGGAKTHVLSLLHGLSQTETVRLICFMEGDFAAEAREMGIPTQVIAGNNIFRVRRKLTQIIEDGGYQVVHCHGSRANLMGWMLNLPVPVVSTVHSDYRLDYLGRPFGRMTYGLINRIALRRLDYHIGVSDPMAELLISRGFDPQRMFSIYNGIDYTPKEPAIFRQEYRRRLGIGEDETVFGIAARINPVKDMSTLVQAFALARDRCPRIRLLIAGGGEEEGKVRQLAAKLCPEGAVTFLGWVDDTDSFYNALDVNMLTSLSETFPYSLTEGAKWRCATIASNVGGVPYLIDDGYNGLLFPAQDARALAGHMVRLATQPQTRREMGERLYKKAAEQFSLEATVRKQKQIYQTILRREQRPKGRRDGVLICGAYGRGNAGDETLLETIVEQMRSIDRDIPICVLTRAPLQTKIALRIQAVHTFDIVRMWRVMRKTRLYISGGGTLMQDVTSTRSILYYLWNIRMAKRRGNQVMLYGCGVGPVNRESNRKRASRILNRYADVITVRDTYSRRVLEELKVTRPKIRVTADPALLCEPYPDSHAAGYLLSVGLEEDERYILFALRDWVGFAEKVPAFAAAAEYAYQTYGLTPVLFAMEPGRDLAAAKAVAARVKCPYRLAGADCRPNGTLNLIARMQIVVSMRLHGLIFAAGLGIPTVGVAYDPKVSGFLDELGDDRYVSLQAVNAGVLCDLIDSAHGSAAAEQDSARVLRALAGENAKIAQELLK